MASIKTKTVPEQVAEHIRDGIAGGRWLDRLPGRDVLARELGVSPRSTQKAVELLKKEGLLQVQGQGRSTVINTLKNGNGTRPLRVALLLFKRVDCREDYLIELRYQLESAGHIPIVPGEGLQELGMKPARVARLVKATKADAWFVAAASREVLQWFVDNKIKVFAFAGRRFGLPIAGTGPKKWELYPEVVRKLIGMGHERIVFLCQTPVRKPSPSLSARSFLAAMQDAGISTGPYNLPDWEDNADGFHRVLESLFKTTPPTALLVDEAHLFHAAYHYLAQRNLKVPQDVSMICTDGDFGFSWCQPSVAHITWDSQPAVQRIMRWVRNVARGVEDVRQNSTPAKFIQGGTIAPPPGR